VIEVTGQHHAGFAVEDLSEAIAFLAHFGFTAGDRMAVAGGSLDRGNGLQGRAAEIVFLEGPGGVLELLRWTGQDARPPRAPAPDEPGAAHVCLQVDDIAAAHAALAADGLDVVCEPQEETSVGLAWMFVRGPGGLRVELMAPIAG
jgi:catechol 2,3-dioxygenase-like lactoylglutathione lyase family enzyme